MIPGFISAGAMGQEAGDWTPAQLASLTGWYISDDPSNTWEAGMPRKLSVFADLSESSRPLTQGISANRPTEDLASLNGRNTVGFDASNSTRVNYNASGGSAPAFINGRNGITIAMVHRHALTSAGTLDTVLAATNSPTNQFLIDRSRGAVANNVSSGGRRNSSDPFSNLQTSTNHGTDWLITVTAFDFVNQSLVMRTNGVEQTLGSAGTSGVGQNDGIIQLGGRAISGSHDRFMTGEIAELVLVHSPGSTSDLEKLDGYLAHQWGLAGSLPGGHPYKFSPP